MRRSTIIRIGAFTVFVATIALVAWLVPVRQYLAAFLDWVHGAGSIGLIVLGAAYIPASLLFLPAWPLTLAAGFVFGVVRGTIAVSIGSVLGATAAFGAGRTLLRRIIEDRVSRNVKFAAVDQAVADQGFKIVLLSRLSPVFPFNLLNYAFGLTKVSFRDYVIASWIGMLPGTIMYVYLGTAAKSLTDLLSGKDERPDNLKKIVFIAGLVITILLTMLIARIAKRAFERAVAGTSRANENGLDSGPDSIGAR